MPKEGEINNLLQDSTILVVDDDFNLCAVVIDCLVTEGASAIKAHDGLDALKLFYESQPNLVILDVNLPRMNGWDVCRQIRLLSEVPILMLTSEQENDSIIRSLDLGADDYMSKPFSLDVLMARCRALLRRNQKGKQTGSGGHDGDGYFDGYLAVDLFRRRVYVEGQIIRMTAKEFEILAYLVKNRGHLRTYQEILGAVWGGEYRDSINYVHVYLSRLRKKLERDPGEPLYLVSERGIGCRFEGFAPEKRREISLFPNI